MDANVIINGIISYLCFLPALTVHECAHAWMANQCGDDTARLEGRITLNPLAHMELVGTVVLPLMSIFLSASGSPLAAFVLGWGKPVPVNIFQLRHPRRDDNLVSLAGPVSNLLLAVLAMGLARGAVFAGSSILIQAFVQIAVISLLLCFFNLLPIPPLDGSHVLKNALQMSHETYFRLSQYGLIMVLIAINLAPVRNLLNATTGFSFFFLWNLFRFPSIS